MRIVHGFQKIQDWIVAVTIQNFLLKHKITPNIISWFRILVALVIVIILVSQKEVGGFYWYLILSLFVIGGTTDALDGALARNTNQITELGKILDPLADKFLTIVLFIILSPFLTWALVVLIISLELAMGISILFFKLFRGKDIGLNGANDPGKTKMFFEFSGIILAIVGKYFEKAFLIKVAEAVILVAAIFAVISIGKSIQDYFALKNNRP